MVKKTVENNPNSSIILTGICKGATTVNNYLTNPQYQNGSSSHIKAVVLESAASSVAPYASQIARHHVPSGVQWTIPIIFKNFLYPYAPWNKPTIIDNAAQFPRTIPVHIGFLAGDKNLDPEDTNSIIEALRKSGINVESYKETDPQLKHARLGQSKGYQQSVQQFLSNIVK